MTKKKRSRKKRISATELFMAILGVGVLALMVVVLLMILGVGK